MSRIRTIKPEFFTSEDIVALSPLARLLYVALWCEADRDGRMLWKPVTFKLRYFPGDSIDIKPLAQSLVDAGLVVLYGEKYAYIPRFSKHQHINPREAASSLPVPDESIPDATRAPRVEHASPPVADASARDIDAQVGREGKGKEGEKKARKRATPLPDGFGISARLKSWAELNGYSLLEKRLEHFVSYARRNGKMYVDWDEALMGAIREDWAKLGATNGSAATAHEAPALRQFQ